MIGQSGICEEFGQLESPNQGTEWAKHAKGLPVRLTDQDSVPLGDPLKVVMRKRDDGWKRCAEYMPPRIPSPSLEKNAMHSTQGSGADGWILVHSWVI